MRRVFITGTAGFIGYHLAALLLREGFTVHGYDGMTDYYDLALKARRHEMLLQNQGFACTIGRLEDMDRLTRAANDFAPDVIVHLAAQAGVRYSLEHPRTYVDSNIIGTFNLLEVARALQVNHLLLASTSSVYGANQTLPFVETDRADTPLTIYAATKKAGEAMAHSYAHLWSLPTTIFRFFTVYGPWGRPDMALYSFVEAILAGRPIDVHNHGKMFRDFTYIDDLVRGIRLLIDVVPVRPVTPADIAAGDSLSLAAPCRVVNIGNGMSVGLMDFIAAIEAALGVKAMCNLMAMQPGEVPATWADNGLLQRLTGFQPQTDVATGVARFVEWYRGYRGV